MNKTIIVIATTMLLLNAPVMAFFGGDGSIDSPFEIASCNDLQGIQNDIKAHYALINDIDCSETINWNEGRGFLPISTSAGSITNEFQGSLDGRYHKIKGLVIKLTDDSLNADRTIQGVGIFGHIRNATVQKLIIEDINIINQSRNASYATGALVGRATNSILSDIKVSGNIMAESYFGGVAGKLSGGLLDNVHANVTLSLGKRWYYDVCWQQGIGGLAGVSSANTQNSSAEIKVVDACPIEYEDKGISSVGGLFGKFNSQSSLKNSFSNFDVNLPEVKGYKVGGVVGELQGSSDIIESFASGVVLLGNAYSAIGGLVGYVIPYSGDVEITNSYSEVAIKYNQKGNSIGALIGSYYAMTDDYSVNISSSYGVDTTLGYDINSCLLGENQNNSTLNIVSSVCDSDSKEDRSQNKYLTLGWDFSKVWEINEGLASPSLQGFNVQQQMF